MHSAAAGQRSSAPPLPETISLYISTQRNHNESIRLFLVDNGATVTEAKEGPVGLNYQSDITAEVPVKLIPALSRQPGFTFAFTDYTRYGKLDGRLSNLVMLYETGAITAEEGAVQSFARWGDSGELITLEVYIESCESIPAIARFREQTFGHLPWWYDTDQECYGSSRQKIIDLSIEFSDLVELTSLPGIRHIQLLPREPTGLKFDTPSSGASLSAPSGSVGQQAGGSAVSAHGADRWHNATRSITGSGVKIGIIDSGFSGFSGLTPGVDIPLQANVHSYCWDQHDVLSTVSINACEHSSNHGTVVADAAYDIAPGAELYITNASGYDQTEQALIWMARSGVTVVNQSRPGTWEGTGNGLPYNANSIHNLLHQAANGTLSNAQDVSGRKMLYTVSAGNSAQRTWFSRKSGYSVNADNYIRFQGSNDCNDVEIQSSEVVIFHLRWAGPWGGANKDLAIEIRRYDEHSEETIWEASSNSIGGNKQSGKSNDNSFDSLP